MASGRLTPCSLWYSPQALQTGSPSALRRHRVVVVVPQLVQHNPNRLVALCVIEKGESFNKHHSVIHATLIQFVVIFEMDRMLSLPEEIAIE
jgi:hypothetical protein